MTFKELTTEDFAELFGVSVAELPEQSLSIIAENDWRYQPLDSVDNNDTVLDFLKRLEHKDFSIVVEGDKKRWVKGWGENLDDFVKSNGEVDSLAPKYIRPNVPMRLNKQFIRSVSPNFELQWYKVFQQWLFRTYFEPYDTIIELGCGSGINVAELAKLFPEKKIIGTDWAEPSVEIVEQMRRLNNWNTEGKLFDFFNPDNEWDIPDNSVVFTVGALEQTGVSHNKVIDFLLEKKPALCVFIEPIYDWYDETNLVDYLAIKAHELRNFWRGFPERLKSLEDENKVQIIKQKRSDFGSLVLEGYSQNIWKPI